MSKNIEKIKKLFNETLHDGIFLGEELTARDVIDSCEEQGKLYTYKGLFIAPARSTFENCDCIRIVFVIKETDGGKVQDVERIMKLINEMEVAIISVDRCIQQKSDGFIYLDVAKKLVQV